ncbi:VOC family protein [Mesorhizobium sp.]|uniref:VOC family protein n=1 Tax=Mesorhizobium sp. TaxID=1871066 RepID=UPI000FE75DBA|nr:VOC family protein [Mesorhizobium sp.]RWE98271.1 MAG: glyoxalase [Mesorhizobium sp.]
MRPMVQRLGYVALNVADIDIAIEDACTVAGVRVVERENGRALLTSNQRHAELILYASNSDSVRSIGLQAHNVDVVAAVRRRAEQAGLTVLSERPSLPCIDRSVTFATSEGHIFEVHTPIPLTQPVRHTGPGIRPRCLDHVNLSSRDSEAISNELQTVLGLRQSERTTGHEIVWMRAADNRHHTVATVKGPSGLHHFSWEFASFDDFKRLGDTLDAQGRFLVWGPGRHGAGDNLFACYIDRSGFLVECIAEMEVIEDENHQARIADPGENLSNPKVVNRWGALPPRLWTEHFVPFAPPITA